MSNPRALPHQIKHESAQALRNLVNTIAAVAGLDPAKAAGFAVLAELGVTHIREVSMAQMDQLQAISERKLAEFNDLEF